jgi:hypothetical protein
METDRFDQWLYRPMAVSINGCIDQWLGRQDSNLGMLGSKPSALPLGDAPIVSQDVVVLSALLMLGAG